MSKALIVLAACVDIRSGRRFEPGQTFEPAPTVEQATRLFKAGCLPETAIAEARKAATEDEKVSGAQARKMAKRQAEIDDAAGKVDAAGIAVANAETALDAAPEDGKAAALAALEKVRADHASASAALADLK